MKLERLDKDYSIKLKSQVVEYLNPDYIYIPIEEKPISLKKEEKIKKGTMLFNSVYSSISGALIGLKKCTIASGKETKCLVIANDFQEMLELRTATRKKINQLTKQDIEKDVKDISLDNLFNKKNYKHIVISGIDDEPYIANETFVQKENAKLLLETIDALLNVFEGSKATIAIKNIDSESINAYNKYLGTYKNIELRLVEDLYRIGKEKNLIEKLRITEEYLFLTASEVFYLYNNLKKRKPIFEKYITISGNAIDNPQVFNVKLGAKVMDILSMYYNLNLEDYDVYVNGLMSGEQFDINDLIVTKELNGLIIMKKESQMEKNCILCGKCIEICPIKSNPLLAYQKKEKIPCIQCGLCSYICPSYINLRKYIKGDTNE